MEQLQQQINNLQKQIDKLTHPEHMRDVIFFDNDVLTVLTSTSTSVVTSVDFVHSSTSSTNITNLQAPDVFLRVYFRGKVYNIPAYKVT
jgi:hypothetical protein